MSGLRAFLAAAGTLGLAACAVGPDYAVPPSPGGPAPRLTETDAAATAPTPLPPQWWRLFGDPVLDGLVTRALERNTDLRVAAANLQRARALLSEARTGKLPSNTINAQYVRQRFGGQVFNAVGNVPPVTTDFYTTGLDAGYEIDLFGGVSRAIRAAIADEQAARAQVDAARVAVAADVAQTYAAGCALAVRVMTAEETVALARRSLMLVEATTRAGYTDRRDLSAARTALAQAEAALPQIVAERRAALYALAFLTGDPPEAVSEDAAACAAVPGLAAPLPVGDGQALIARRPDIRVAERQLARDTERVGVAVAALYPSIRLLGTPSFGATRPGDIGTSASFGFSVGPLISWNFPFNGAARARVRAAKAETEGALARFDAAVLGALQETEQALARLSGALAAEARLGEAAGAAAETARLTEMRFKAGSEDAVQLLAAQREWRTAQSAHAEAQGARATAQVSLFRALGGGWENQGPSAPPAAGTDRSKGDLP
jgi:NodT family efflux transporter outer membrane factor (OMF) lipoprotein